MNVIDKEAILERIDGDVEILHEISEIFLEDIDNLMDDVKSAVGNKDALELQRSAHTLKGVVSNFSAESTTQAALQLEMAGRNNNLENVAHLYEILTIEVNNLRSDVQELEMELAT